MAVFGTSKLLIGATARKNQKTCNKKRPKTSKIGEEQAGRSVYGQFDTNRVECRGVWVRNISVIERSLNTFRSAL